MLLKLRGEKRAYGMPEPVVKLYQTGINDRISFRIKKEDVMKTYDFERYGFCFITSQGRGYSNIYN